MPTSFLLKNPPVENTRKQQRTHQAAEKTVEQMENLLASEYKPALGRLAWQNEKFDL